MFVPFFLNNIYNRYLTEQAQNTWLFLQAMIYFCDCKQWRRNQQRNQQKTQKRECNIEKTKQRRRFSESEKKCILSPIPQQW